MYGAVFVAVIIFIVAGTSSESCGVGWDPRTFLYTIASLYLLDFLLCLGQRRSLSNFSRESYAIVFLRFAVLCTMVGFYISANINYYGNKNKNTCKNLLWQTLFVIILGYFEMLKCFCCSLILCVLIPIVIIASRRA